MAMLERNPRFFMDYEDNGAFGDDLFGSYPSAPVSPLSQVAPVAPVAPITPPLATPEPYVPPVASRYNISSPEVREDVFAAQEAVRQAEATQLAQEAEAARQAEIERQAQQEAQRQAEIERQGALQRAEVATVAPVQDALTYLNSNPTGTPSPEQQKVIDDYFAANPINFDVDSPNNTFARGFDLNSSTGLTLNSIPEQQRLNDLDKIINPLTQQILGQGLTDKWSGEGFGSAEANARDMAKIMAGIGITDISQFGKFTKTGFEESVIPDGKGGFVDQNGKPVDPSLVKTNEYQGESGGWTDYTAPIGTREFFGNKITKQEVPITYSERQTGNFFGGTFEGKGNTGYGVQFDAQGNPYFYTQGASSNDLVNMFASNPLLGKVATAAAAYFGGPAGVAALQAAMGKSVEDIAKAAVLTYAGGEIAGKIAGSSELINTVGADAANVIGKSAGKYVSSEGKASIMDSLVGGAIDTGITQITDTIPEFKDLSQGQQDFTKNVVRTAIQNGGNLSMGDLVDAAITAGTAAVKASKQGTIAQAIQADKTVNDAVTSELNKQTTIDASGARDVNAAAEFADAQGYNKFIFDGKTYNVGNNNAENTIAQLEAEALAQNTANNLKGGEFEGVDAAVAANAARNNTVIGNAEADNPEEAAYLAKQRNPTGNTFTYGGQTYTMGVSDAAVNQSLNETQKTAVLDDIKNAKTFNEAFATARSSLGPGQTFTWQGKEYSTATAAERPDLSTPSIDEINARNLATSTDASKTVAAQSDTAARETASQELAKQQANATKATESSGFFSNLAKSIQDQMKLSSEAANDYLKNNPNSPITNSVSTAYEAAGNLQKNAAGGVALLLDNKPLADAFVKSGDDLTKFGQSIGNGVVDTKNWNDTMSLLENAKGFDKIGVLAGRIMDGNSGLGRQVEVELRQELPGLFLGGGSVKGILLATGAMDVAETTGNAALEAYDAAAKRGLTHADALTEARKAGAAAGVAEAAIQLTLGKVADVIVGKVGSVAGKAGTKVLGEGFVEAGQEGSSSLAVNAALGQDLDVNKALTQSIAGAAVGKGTSVTTSPVDIATSQTINNNITTAVTSGDASAVNTAITNSVQQSLTSGASVNTAVGTTVSSAITNGADAASSITNAVTTAVESGADSTQVVSSAVTSAIDAGADVSTSVSTAVQAAVTSGADTATAINSSVTAAVTSGADATTAVNTAVTAAVETSVKQAVTNGTDVSTAITNSVSSSVSSAVTNNTSVTTAVDTAVSTAISSAVTNNTDVTSAVTSSVSSAITSAIDGKVDSSTAISTAVDSAVTTAIENNVDSNTAITTAVNTAINTAINANTNANVNTVVNDAVTSAVDAAVNSGVDVNTAVNTAVDAAINANVNTKANIDIPALVKTAVEKAKTSAELVDLRNTVNELITKVSAIPATPVVDPTKTTKATTPQSAGLNAGLLAGVMSAGELARLPPQMLKAYMTQDKFVDPLAKLQSLQEDMNTEKMQPQVNTQDTEMPDQGTWKYGNAPDDIESLFGEEEEEATFKEGGYVAPLQMASGGAMPLPLLVKSGGALGALPRPDGRLDFRHGAHVAGDGDGQSDDIKAMLADGEFVFPADVVSALGNGSTKAGSDKLYEMMHAIRARARSKKPKDLPPPALKSPLDYLKKKR